MNCLTLLTAKERLTDLWKTLIYMVFIDGPCGTDVVKAPLGVPHRLRAIRA